MIRSISVSRKPDARRGRCCCKLPRHHWGARIREN
jgi:hypothetical protein